MIKNHREQGKSLLIAFMSYQSFLILLQVISEKRINVVLGKKHYYISQIYCNHNLHKKNSLDYVITTTRINNIAQLHVKIDSNLKIITYF